MFFSTKRAVSEPIDDFKNADLPATVKSRNSRISSGPTLIQLFFRRLHVVANADFRAAVRRLDLRRADLELRVRRPTGDVARIFRVEHQRSGLEIQPINIKQLAPANIQLQKQLVRKI